MDNIKEYNMTQSKKIKVTLIITICIFIIVGIVIFICVRHNKKEVVFEKAREHGYNIEFSDSTMFYINEGAVTYYYSLDMSGINFIKYDIKIEEPGVKVKEGELIVSIKRKNKDGSQIKGRFHDTRTIIDDEGNEEILYLLLYTSFLN